MLILIIQLSVMAMQNKKPITNVVKPQQTMGLKSEKKSVNNIAMINHKPFGIHQKLYCKSHRVNNFSVTFGKVADRIRIFIIHHTKNRPLEIMLSEFESGWLTFGIFSLG